MPSKKSRRWRSTRRRLLRSCGVEVPPGYDPFFDEVIWGAENFGPVINRSTPQVFRLLAGQQIDADQGPSKEIAA
jgi:hypothetical protein